MAERWRSVTSGGPGADDFSLDRSVYAPCWGLEVSVLLKCLLLSGLSPSSNMERFRLSGLPGGRLYASILIDRRYLLGSKSKPRSSGLTDLVTLKELWVLAPRGELIKSSFTKPLMGLARLLSLAKRPRMDRLAPSEDC